MEAVRFDRRAMLAAIATSALAAAAPAQAKSNRHAATQALIDGYVKAGLVPGAVVGIVHPGRFNPTWLMSGRTEFEGGSRVSPDTIWRIYSMTKPVTGVAVMQQVMAGRLTLDTPIADIMPEFKAMQVLVDPTKSLDSRPAQKPVLVRHLLTHTAGFTYTIAGNGPLELAYRQQGMLPMSSGMLMEATDSPAPALTEYMARLAKLPLYFEPGTAWRYSIALDVAGGLLERLTGKTLDQVFDTQLFGPLGMTDTGFWLKPAQLPRLAGLYAWADPKTRKPAETPFLADSARQSEWAEPPRMLAGGAGLVSSAENYARFAQMMLNDGMFEGKMLLPRTGARLAMSNQMEKGVFLRQTEGNGSGGRVTLFDTSRADGLPAASWGWGGAASTLFHVDPVRGQAVVLMLQSAGNPKGPNETMLARALATDAGS